MQYLKTLYMYDTQFDDVPFGEHLASTTGDTYL